MAEFKDYTFLRFQVELNLEGFPDDDGEARATEVRDALLAAARRFDPEATVNETTE